MTTRARQWLIVLGTVVLVTAAYAVAGFVGVLHLLRSQVVSFVHEHYGRTASIGEIRFNPFTFALEAKDFTLPDADGKPMLAFGRLWLDLDGRHRGDLRPASVTSSSSDPSSARSCARMARSTSPTSRNRSKRHHRPRQTRSRRACSLNDSTSMPAM